MEKIITDIDQTFIESGHLISELFNDDYYEKITCSGFVIEKSLSLNPKLVIDAGCGHNLYKNKIPNLIGFDPGDFEGTDFKSTILEADFNLESADVVLALGSIHFISKPYIRKNVKKMLSWLKPGGLIICRANYETEFIKKCFALGNPKRIVPWSINFLNELTVENNLILEEEPFTRPWQDKNHVAKFEKFFNTKPEETDLQKIFWVWKKL